MLPSVFLESKQTRRLKWCQTGFIQKNVKLFQNVSICFFPPKPQGTAVQGAGISLASSILFSA